MLGPGMLRLRHFVLAALTATAVAVPAFAQSAGSSPSVGAQASNLSVYPQCQTAPTKSESEKAHSAYLLGKSSFDEGDYVTAINYFKDAYRRDCTKHELLNIIARAYELKGDLPEAINALEVYLQRLPPNDPVADEIQKRMKVLKDKLAAHPPAPPASSSPAAGASPTSTAPTPTPAPSGATSAAPPPPQESSGGHSAVPWVLVGAGVVLVGGGIPVLVGGLTIKNNATTNALNKGCTPDGSPTSTTSSGNCTTDDKIGYSNRSQDGATQANIGGVLLAVGGLAVVGGLVWHFLETPADAHASTSGARRRPALRVTAAPGYGGVAASGSF